MSSSPCLLNLNNRDSCSIINAWYVGDSENEHRGLVTTFPHNWSQFILKEPVQSFPVVHDKDVLHLSPYNLSEFVKYKLHGSESFRIYKSFACSRSRRPKSDQCLRFSSLRFFLCNGQIKGFNFNFHFFYYSLVSWAKLQQKFGCVGETFIDVKDDSFSDFGQLKFCVSL